MLAIAQDIEIMIDQHMCWNDYKFFFSRLRQRAQLAKWQSELNQTARLKFGNRFPLLKQS